MDEVEYLKPSVILGEGGWLTSSHLGIYEETGEYCVALGMQRLKTPMDLGSKGSETDEVVGPRFHIVFLNEKVIDMMIERLEELKQVFKEEAKREDKRRG